MREYLFRGQIIGTKDWAIGSLVYSPSENQYYIVEHCDEELSFPVIPETVGEFTGLCDKNGKKIFEGDILRYNAVIRRVSWNVGECGFCVIDKQGFGSSIWSFNKFARTAKVESEIIGNIHDNKDLLEVEE